MKRIVALFLVFTLILSGCSISVSKNNKQKQTTVLNESTTVLNEPTTIVEGGSDVSKEIANIERQVYKQAIDAVGDGYYVREVKAKYFSKEYLDELEYNSKENVFFGYTLSELNNSFGEGSYVFTVGKDGNTVVEQFKPYDDTTDKMIRNVAIGAGVIVVCVVVAAVTAGAGVPAVAAVFAAGAKGAAIGACSGAVIDGSIAGVTTAIQTDGDKDAIVKAVKEDASEGFMWGAIAGGVTGGFGKAMSIKKATSAGLKAKEAVTIQKEAKWSSETISNIRNMDEYRVLKGSKEVTINGRKALVKNVNLKYKSDLNGKLVTNVQRMKKGYAPIEPKTGKPYELHHIGQENDSALAVVTNREHNKYYKVLHDNRKVSTIDRKKFNVVRKKFWKAYVKAVKK